MKKTILFGIVLLISLNFVFAIGLDFPDGGFGCDEEICVCGDELCIFDEVFYESPFYCPSDCEMTCSDLGYIMPPDCLDYGYHLECDSCCVEGFPSRAEVDDFCRGFGFIRLEDCPEGMICDEMGYIFPDDCTDLGYITYDDCPICGEGYEECDSCCPSCEDYKTICPFPWWLLVIGFVIGYYFKKQKKK